MSYKIIKHKKGDTFIANLNFYNVVDGVKTVIDISGKTLKVGIFENINDLNAQAKLLKTLTIPSDTNATNGIYILTLTATEMTLAPKTYFCEFSIVSGDLVNSTEIFKIEIQQDLIK